MPDTYITRGSESVASIAAERKTSPTALREANPELSKVVGDNDDVRLPAGMQLTLPDRTQKSQPVASNRRTTFRVNTGRKYLRLTLQDASGRPLEGWNRLLMMDGRSVPTRDDSKTGVMTTAGPLPPRFDHAALVLSPLADDDDPTPPSYDIRVYVGGMETLVGPDDGRKAIQKILTNLGYYRGPIDGNLDNGPTRPALRTFQGSVGLPSVNGRADEETCARLVQAQQNMLLPPERPEVGTTASDRDASLEIAQDAGAALAAIQSRARYFEPTSADQTTPRVITRAAVFPAEAFVAPSNPGGESVNPNVIRQSARKLVFLDTGAWLYFRDYAYSFGLIWGRHVYLCEYKPGGGGTSVSGARPGLDVEFFNGMGGRVRVVAKASATWAPAADFDWDHLYLVVPDLHLMTGPVSALWKPNGNMNDHRYYDLEPELALLDFVKTAIAIAGLRGKIRAIQIGDAFDLWIGCSLEPYQLPNVRKQHGLDEASDAALFAKNENRAVQLLYPDAVRTVTRWVRQIEGTDSDIMREIRWYEALTGKAYTKDNWVKALLLARRYYKNRDLELDLRTDRHEVWLNPAVAALQLLETHCDLTYVYGNHDNYLILPEVCQDASLRQRQRYFDGAPGVFMEHGHRMEAVFEKEDPGYVPHNHDGALSGYIETMKVYRTLEENPPRPGQEPGMLERLKISLADQWGLRWQRGIYTEFAKMSVGRHERIDEGLKPPHIVVCGHTHHPNLLCISTAGAEQETVPTWRE